MPDHSEEEVAATPQPAVAESVAIDAERQALIDRLAQITAEVAESSERRGYGVHLPARLQTEELSPGRIREVVMNVNVYWCDDGCVDGPAATPARDDDLLLLKPFAESLRQLDVQHTEVTDAGLQTIGELTSLEALNLAGSAIQGEGLKDLATLINLRQLDLRDTAILAEHTPPLTALTALTEINLPASALTDATLIVLSQLPRLKRLNLTQTPVTDHGLAHLARLKQLEQLDLSETEITDTGLRSLSGLTNLKQLNLSKTRITGAGLAHLSGLEQIQSLNLEHTAVDDAGLAHLSGLTELNVLDLTGTRIHGPGLVHLQECRRLREIALPPISVGALAAVNVVKHWHRLSLTLIRTNDPVATVPVSAAWLNDMPELMFLQVTSSAPLEQLHIQNCPQLASIVICHAGEQLAPVVGGLGGPSGETLPPTSLHLTALPVLRTLNLTGRFDGLSGDDVLPDVISIAIDGSVTTETVRGISRCRGLRDFNMQIARLTGDPLPELDLSEFPQAKRVWVSSTTPAAAWITRLISNMPVLKSLDLNVPGLTAADLSRLEKCTQLTYLNIRGIDDPGEPLSFLNALPHLDLCLVLGCPRVGRIRLTSQAGLRRLYFKFGRLDSLEIDGTPNLTAVHLGHEAHGYNDHDARLNRLDLSQLTVRNVPSLLYLMVDGLDSTTEFHEISMAATPQLRGLLLRAPPANRQPVACRLTVEGEFPELVQHRLFHLSTDQASIDRLNASPILNRRELVGVNVMALDDQ